MSGVGRKKLYVTEIRRRSILSFVISRNVSSNVDLRHVTDMQSSASSARDHAIDSQREQLSVLVVVGGILEQRIHPHDQQTLALN